MVKMLKEFRRRHRRSQKKLKHPLIPRDWLEYCYDPASMRSYRLKDEFTQAIRQAHFNSCFGNIYVKQDYRGVPSSNQCMLMSALVGSGNYTSFQFLDLVTHKKFDESYDHTLEPTGFGAGQWMLMSEMEV